jgi:DNA-binding response OmpR family regulator
MNVRILIIDNEPRWINFARSDLGGFEIVVAPDINTALKELEDDQFDLVIASSGYLAILEDISKKFSDKQVVVTTVKPNTQEALDAYRKGAKRYITKSFREKDLLRNVRELVPSISDK